MHFAGFLGAKRRWQEDAGGDGSRGGDEAAALHVNIVNRPSFERKEPVAGIESAQGAINFIVIHVTALTHLAQFLNVCISTMHR